MALTAQNRRRGLIAILAITLLMYSGFFMVIPLVAVHYVGGLGFAATTVGLALAMRQLLQQGATVFGGMLADRLDVRWLIGAGVLIRAAGFASMAWAASPLGLFLAMALSAVGGALFDAPSRAAIATLTTEKSRARFFSLSSVVSGVGMTLGPLIGAMLIRQDFAFVCLTAAACFVGIFLITLLLPRMQIGANPDASLSAGLGLAMRDRTFLTFTALLMGYWFMWVQMTISVPLAAERLTGSSDTVGLVYALNAGMTVVLQYPLLRLAERWLRLMPMLVIGMALMALGLGAIALSHSLASLLVCVTIFTLGTLLATPTQQSVTVALANPQALGSYFGVNALALAFGGGLGNLTGGLLMDTARRLGQPNMPWLFFGLIGLASAIGLALLGEQLQRHRRTAHLMSGHYSASQ